MRALGFGLTLIIVAVLLPRVFAATEQLLLVLLTKATEVVESIDVQHASVLQNWR